MKIALTGVAGYLGSKVAKTLLEEGHEVYGVDNFFHRESKNILIPLLEHKNFHFIFQDVLDKTPKLQGWIQEADYVLPFSAVVGHPICENNKFLTTAVNQKWIEWLVDFCNNSNTKIIFPTTNSGYGITSGNELCTEESPLNPISHYAVTKVAAEKYVVEHSREFVTLRLATVYGVSYRMRKDLMVNDFIYRAWKDKVNVLFESWMHRNFVCIDDVARCFSWLIQNWDKARNNVFNLGDDAANMTKKELAETIYQRITHTIIEEEFSKDPDQRNYIISSQKIYDLGFECKSQLSQEIPKIVACYELLDTPQLGNS